MEELHIKELGFVNTEIIAIREHFLMTLSIDDWELISFVTAEEHEEGDEFLKLPTGRWVYFEEELLRKEMLYQID
ncbi:hypothetical protein LJR015_002797 [Peribacillus frigoritolerans]|uniref:hypothetical protein n=1 Tax=Peribacillus frigoritolerans TaxID=450367 RepID=UPI003ED11F1C